ncbi:ATP-binding protein [Pseudomonadota bacterium]
MSIWVLISVLLLVFWWLHVQGLNEKRAALAKELKSLKESHGDLASTLKLRGRRLDVLFSAVNEVVMRVDRLGRVMAANPHASEMFEMSRAHGLPQSMVVFYHDPEWHTAFSKALKLLPKSSSLPDMHVNERVLAPRLVPLGKEQALLLCVDVTEKHLMEEQRKSLFANLMHDLKTPLTSILGYARSIQSFDDDPELRREAAGVIAEESKRVNRFLDALLTLEQMEHLNPDHSASSSLWKECQTVLDGFSTQLDAKEIEIEWDIDESLGDVNIVDSDLHRILDNVIGNAVRYGPESSKIFVKGFCDDESCSLEVLDQGGGVPQKELVRLTERFYRSDEARSQLRGEGHGLGLAIVKELVEKYGGELDIQNHEQYGLSVTVTLPLTK